jgi:hypothetical protein
MIAVSRGGIVIGFNPRHERDAAPLGHTEWRATADYRFTRDRAAENNLSPERTFDKVKVILAGLVAVHRTNPGACGGPGR